MSPCGGSLRGTAWISRSFFHGLNPHWFLQPEVIGTCLLVLEPWAEEPGVGLGYPSQIFIHHTWVWDQLGPCLHPSYQSRWMWFNSVVVRFLFNSIYDGSKLWLFYILLVILMWLCKEASHVCLHCHLDQKSVFYFEIVTRFDTSHTQKRCTNK